MITSLLFAIIKEKSKKLTSMKQNVATITSKGQITIPINIREEFKMESGVKLEFVINNGRLIVFPINKSVKNLKGFLKKPKKALSVEEMNDAIRDCHDRD